MQGYQFKYSIATVDSESGDWKQSVKAILWEYPRVNASFPPQMATGAPEPPVWIDR